MNFTKVTPKVSPKNCQNLTTGHDFPLRTTLAVNSHFKNDLALETEEGMAESPHYDHLHFDGLCQNTRENLSNSSADEEKTEHKERRVLSCSAVLLMFIVCVVSLSSLVLTLLMLTGNISSRCSCVSSKGKLLFFVNYIVRLKRRFVCTAHARNFLNAIPSASKYLTINTWIHTNAIQKHKNKTKT
jgi:hypothetical protein